MNNLKLIVFDIDGTLAETDDYYVEKGVSICRKVLPFVSPERMGKIVRPVIMAGETGLHGFYRLLDMVGLDTIISKVHSKFSVGNEYKYKEVKGMRKTIQLLSEHYILGIITSGGRGSTEAFLKKYDLEKYIKYVVSSEDCTYIKPHPAPMIKIMEEAGVEPENSMLVGDTVFDIICAKRAGAIAAAVKSGFDTERFLKSQKADLYLDSVNDLRKILKTKK
ncbi:MAG: HAD family hydrolase [Anaerolineaceae bacterium]|nr:HAD family hydrolase [Anaerolineaceae bacterium]